MLNVERSRIVDFVDMFLKNTMFSDLVANQQEDLKEFLTDYLAKLYEENTKDIISIMDQMEQINPFMIKLALGYGLLEEDATELVRILFMKINEYFYKQGSKELIKQIKRIFDYYGLRSKINKVIYNKNDDKYYLEDVETGERRPADEDELITPGHLVHRADYSTYTFTNEYDTVIIYIELNLQAQVDKKMQHPVALLHAYAITLHRTKLVSFYIKGNIYDLPLIEYLDFLRYYYIRYIKIKYPDFQLDEDPLTMWNLIITDDNNMEASKELLSDFLSGAYLSRDGLAYYLRISAHILNNYKFNTQPKSIEDIREHLNNINEQLLQDIESLSHPTEFSHNIGIMLIYYEEFLNTLEHDTVLDKYVKNTLRYLFMFVMLAIVSDFIEQVKHIVNKFKRYYLPIYTQFIYDESKTFTIRNEFFRIFEEDKNSLILKSHFTSLLESRDQQTVSALLKQKDYLIEVLDAATIILRSAFLDERLIADDKFNIGLSTRTNGLLDMRDKQTYNTFVVRNDNTDIIDSVIITIS